MPVAVADQLEHDGGFLFAGFGPQAHAHAFVPGGWFVEFRKAGAVGGGRTQAQHHRMAGGGFFAAGFGHGLEGRDAVQGSVAPGRNQNGEVWVFGRAEVVAVLRLKPKAQGINTGRNLVVLIVALAFADRRRSEQGGFAEGIQGFVD